MVHYLHMKKDFAESKRKLRNKHSMVQTQVMDKVHIVEEMVGAKDNDNQPNAIITKILDMSSGIIRREIIKQAMWKERSKMNKK